jgi:hypothetical protein
MSNGAWKHKFVLDEHRFLVDGAQYQFANIVKAQIVFESTSINFIEASGMDDCAFWLYMENGQVLNQRIKRARHLLTAFSPMGALGPGKAAREMHAMYMEICQKSVASRLEKYNLHSNRTGRILFDEESSIIDFDPDKREVFVNGVCFGCLADMTDYYRQGPYIVFKKKKNVFSKESAVINMMIDHDIKSFLIKQEIPYLFEGE